MATGFLECVDSLAKIVNRFDKESNRERLRLILMPSKIELKPDGALSRYVNVLLHSLVFPADKATWQEGMRDLSRIANFLRKLAPGRKANLKNTGLPLPEFVSCFSYDCVTWIRQQKGLKTSLDRVEGPDTDVLPSAIIRFGTFSAEVHPNEMDKRYRETVVLMKNLP